MLNILHILKRQRGPKALTKRQVLDQIFKAVFSMLSSYMVWKLIGLVLGNDAPIVVVLTESMEPGFKRGDILFLRNGPREVGDIAVFQFRRTEIPIVHRVFKRFGTEVLTKGDNNRGDDVPLYENNQRLLKPENIISTVCQLCHVFACFSWCS